MTYARGFGSALPHRGTRRAVPELLPATQRAATARASSSAASIRLRRYRASASLPSDRPLTPEDFAVEPYLDDCDRLFELHEACGGDFIWSASAFWGIPWLEAALGCPILADHSTGSIHAQRPRGFARPGFGPRLRPRLALDAAGGGVSRSHGGAQRRTLAHWHHADAWHRGLAVGALRRDGVHPGDARTARRGQAGLPQAHGFLDRLRPSCSLRAFRSFTAASAPSTTTSGRRRARSGIRRTPPRCSRPRSTTSSSASTTTASPARSTAASCTSTRRSSCRRTSISACRSSRWSCTLTKAGRAPRRCTRRT